MRELGITTTAPTVWQRPVELPCGGALIPNRTIPKTTTFVSILGGGIPSCTARWYSAR